MVNEVNDSQEEIISEFAMFDDWMDRYEYLIDLGKQLPSFPDEHRTEENKIQGCQSQVWFISHIENQRLFLEGISDAAIVSGLIAVLLRVYSGKKTSEILSSDPQQFVQQLGFDKHLSPTRSNGLHSMLSAIFDKAQREQTQGS